MSFFKINGNDYSMYINQLKIDKNAIYKTQTNTSGNTTAKLLNIKRVFTVGIIPLDDISMAKLQKDISKFFATISYRDPETNELVENVKCIIPVNEVEYYTIQANNVSYRAFNIPIQEL